MNWEMIGATGEWAGALAVVVTLFYLARQIRTSTNQATADAESAIQREFIALQDGLTDPNTSSVMRRGFYSFSSLSEKDKYFFHAKLSTFINFFEGVLRREEKGLTSRTIVQTYGNVLVALVGTPGGREFWSIASGTFHELSTNYINKHLDSGDWAALETMFPYFLDKDGTNDA